MTNKKQTKRSLLSSFLALILCLSMLVGTTFAWFTDSVTSQNNVIMSGNLDIELDYWDGDSWETVSGAANVLSGDKWEPGYTDVAYLRIKNAGSLALNYMLGINVVTEQTGKTADGQTIRLSDYIYFDVIEDLDAATAEYETREDALAAVQSPALISTGYTQNETLLAGDVAYLAMVVYMPTTVGNEANHDGVNVPYIDLGINVLATQAAAESDSFDEYYDTAATPWSGEVDYTWYDAEATEFELTSPEELAALAALINGVATPATTYSARAAQTVQDNFAGKTITLAGDINLNNMAWTPIGNWDNAFAGTFDGQGHTIYGLNINDPEGEGVGFFGVVENATIKNVNLCDVKINADSMVAGLVGAAYPATIENCHVSGNVNIVADWAYVAGVAGYCYYGTQVDNCSVIGAENSLIKSETRNAVGGITAWLLEGDHKVTNCTVKNLDLVGWTNVGGISGFVHYSNTISGCTVENVNLVKTRVNGNPGIGLIAGGYSYNANKASTLTNNTVKNVTMSGTHIAYASYNELYGSEYDGATSANFVLDNSVSGVTNNLVVVAKDTTGLWKGEDGVYYVSTADDLKAFANYVNSFSNYEYPFKDATIVLTADIDLGGAEWTPIGDYRFSANRFCGTFDGQGHTISNFKITKKTDKNDSNKSSYGFFGNVEGTVKNLTIANATVSSYAYTGALIGRLNSGLVENCHVIDSTVAPSYWQGGIMIGQINGGSVKNCTVANSTVSGKSALGGLAGPVTAEDGDILFENCSVKDSAIVQTGSFGGNYEKYFAGMFGYLESGDNRIDLNNCTVTNTTVKGEISSLLSGDNEGNIYFNGVKGITTAADLKAALNAGGNILLGTNIAMEAIYIQNPNFVLDGNGYTITQSGTNTYALIDTQGGSVTLQNVTFDGINGGAVVRTVGAKFNATNVTVKNSSHTQQQGLFRLMGESTIENCTFVNNNCSMAITLNYDGANNDPQIVKNCVFENNTCNSTAVVYYVKGAGCTLTGNTFVNNTVNTSGNAATVYMGFTENNVVTGNLFKGNDVTGTTKRVAGALMIGYETVLSGNAFIDNTVTGSIEGLGNDVCASVYYTDIDLSGNYWGGNAPVANDNYFVEYPDRHNVIINDYLTTYGN